MTRNEIICGDCLTVMRTWPAGCCDMAMTSIPYWKLRSYSWGGDEACKHKWLDIDEVLQGCACGARRPRYGLEPTLQGFLAKTVEIFAEVRRVLKPWGSLWLNVGDAYTGPNNKSKSNNPKMVQKFASHGSQEKQNIQVLGLKTGDLIRLPDRVAGALQVDGWYLRSAIVWCKAWSFHDCDNKRIEDRQEGLFGQEIVDVIDEGKSYVGSCMPESVNGWRWERCRVKVKSERHRDRISGSDTERTGMRNHSGTIYEKEVTWKLCPGCSKCQANDGLVLRKGSWRPTSAYEMLFEMTPNREYYADGEAVREELIKGAANSRFDTGKTAEHQEQRAQEGYRDTTGRNLRNVWCIQTEATSVSHYATFPEKLVEPCIKASTSEKGNCPKCGMPWARVIDHKQIKRYRAQDRTNRHNAGAGVNSCGNTVAGVANTTLGWRPTCECGAGDPVPAIVFDPFSGTNTVGVVAERLGRDWVGTEINPDYVKIAEDRMKGLPLLLAQKQPSKTKTTGL